MVVFQKVSCTDNGFVEGWKGSGDQQVQFLLNHCNSTSRDLSPVFLIQTAASILQLSSDIEYGPHSIRLNASPRNGFWGTEAELGAYPDPSEDPTSRSSLWALILP